MSATKQVRTFSDLYTDLQNRAREQTGIAATENQAKRYINTALQDMHLGQNEKYPWAERSGVLITMPKYSTGTILATNGSLSITGSSTLWNTVGSMARNNMRPGGKIKIAGSNEVYEIKSVTNDTLATMKSVFVGDSVTAAEYVYFEDEYELPSDYARPVDQHRFDEQRAIDFLGRTEFRRRFPTNSTLGKPSVATMGYSDFQIQETATITSITSHPTLGNHLLITAVTADVKADDLIEISGTTSYNREYKIVSATGFIVTVKGSFLFNETGTLTRNQQRNRAVRFHPAPDTLEMIQYQYVTSNLVLSPDAGETQNMVDDDDEPIVPIQYRHAIVFHALSHWYRDKKDDQRSQEAASEYTNIMMRIIADYEIGSQRPQFRPRLGTYRSRAKRPWRGGGGRYDLNGRFDRMED